MKAMGLDDSCAEHKQTQMMITDHSFKGLQLGIIHMRIQECSPSIETFFSEEENDSLCTIYLAVCPIRTGRISSGVVLS